jgi:uncharacterized protein YjbI with pentapeptide repeats
VRSWDDVIERIADFQISASRDMRHSTFDCLLFAVPPWKGFQTLIGRPMFPSLPQIFHPALVLLSLFFSLKMKFLASAVFLALAAPGSAFVNPASRSSVQLNDVSTNLGAMKSNELDNMKESLSKLALASMISLSLLSVPLPAMADGQTEKFRLPPIDVNDKLRCSLNSSSMGQANAARDKLYDLRQCKLSGASAPGFDLSGVIMTDTDVSKANFKEAYFSKAYLQCKSDRFCFEGILVSSILYSQTSTSASNFDGTDFTNAIVDRASFKGSSLRGTIFTNAVLTGTSFDGADLEGADFTDSYIGGFDIKNICRNPTLKGENPVTGADTRESVGCVPN